MKPVIKGTAGEVYINDVTEPLYQIYELKHGDVKGPIVLKGNAKSHFANFTYTLDENPALQLPVKELPELEDNVITRYEVSNAIGANQVMTKPRLNVNDIPDLEWKSLDCEYTGTINIARIAKRDKDHNVALVKVILSSDKDQSKLLEFGYSDIAQVFVNGKAVYMGNNTFRSRDYRYLGTIGYFDAAFLDLKKGDNEIVIAIMEAFGGWGMKARLGDMEGIKVK